jgi:uncharacterized Zn finger protein
MRLEDSAIDDMNHMATDILECGKCDSENLELLGSHEYEEQEFTVLEWKCKECGHVFYK